MTDTTPMRERLARALWFVDAAPHGMRLEQWANVEAQDYYLVRVDAILSVLETPSRDLVEMAIDAYERAPGMMQHKAMKAAIAAMVNAIREGA